MSTKDLLTLVFGSVGALIALATLVSTYLEYLRKGRQSRAEMFFELRTRLKQEPLNDIAELIDLELSGDATVANQAKRQLMEIQLRDKRDYIGLFEEVSLVLDWKLIERQTAHYMFGYYAILCWESAGFWANVNKLNPYWERFHRFYWQMKAEQAKQRDLTTVTGVAGSPESAAAQATAADRTIAGEVAVTLQIPPVLRPSFAGSPRTISASGATVGELLTRICEEHPRVRDQIFGVDGGLNRFLNVYLNDEDVRVLDGLETPIEDRSTVVLLPASSGG